MKTLLHAINHSAVWGWLVEALLLLLQVGIWGLKTLVVVSGILLFLMLKSRGA